MLRRLFSSYNDSKRIKEDSSNSTTSTSTNDNENNLEKINLLNLPYETLVEILSLCDVQTFFRLISTCKTFNTLSIAEERTLYRHLYHREYKNIRAFFSNIFDDGETVLSPKACHSIYSPTIKNGTTILIRSTDPLPVEVIHSWKVQFKMMMLWKSSNRGRIINKECMGCHSRKNPEDLAEIDEFGIRLCPICIAKELIAVADINMYGLVKKEVKKLSKLSIPYEQFSISSKKTAFYSRTHLRSLTTEKHGTIHTFPRLIKVEEEDERLLRQNTVAVATLLHAGRDYRSDLSGLIGVKYFSNQGRYDLEFDQYVQGMSYTAATIIKRRPLASIISEYASFVKSNETNRAFVPNNNGTHYFLPAINPGPLIPTPESIAALVRIRKELFSSENSIGEIFYPQSKERIVALQDYIVLPTEENWSILSAMIKQLETLEAEKNCFRWRNFVSLTSTEVNSWEVIQPFIDSIEKETKNKVSEVLSRRVQFIAQVATILGAQNSQLTPSLAPYLFVEKLGGKEIPAAESSAGKIRTWAAPYVKGKFVKPVLTHIYEEMSRHRENHFVCLVDELTDYTEAQFTNVIFLLSSFFDGTNQRCHKLSERNRVPLKVVEQELKDAVRLIKNGLITFESIHASLCKQPERCTCGGARYGRCKAQCWYRSLNDNGWCGSCGQYHIV